MDPTTAITKSSNTAVLLPLVSETRLTTMSPTNDPTGNMDWMVNRAHSKWQYSPNSEVMVKESTTVTTKRTDLTLGDDFAGLFLVDEVNAMGLAME
jgi:hypothetical protein